MNISEEKILDALKDGPMPLEELALKVGRAKKVTTVVVDDDFRDDLWTLIDHYKIRPGRTLAMLELCK